MFQTLASRRRISRFETQRLLLAIVDAYKLFLYFFGTVGSRVGELDCDATGPSL